MKFSELSNGDMFIFAYEVKWAQQTHLMIRIPDKNNRENDVLRRVKLREYEVEKIKRKFPHILIFYKTGYNSYRSTTCGIDPVTNEKKTIKNPKLCSGYVYPAAEIVLVNNNDPNQNIRKILESHI